MGRRGSVEKSRSHIPKLRPNPGTLGSGNHVHQFTPIVPQIVEGLRRFAVRCLVEVSNVLPSVRLEHLPVAFTLRERSVAYSIGVAADDGHERSARNPVVESRPGFRQYPGGRESGDIQDGCGEIYVFHGGITSPCREVFRVPDCRWNDDGLSPRLHLRHPVAVSEHFSMVGTEDHDRRVEQSLTIEFIENETYLSIDDSDHRPVCPAHLEHALPERITHRRFGISGQEIVGLIHRNCIEVRRRRIVRFVRTAERAE